MKRIYMDHNATTPTDGHVLEAMARTATQCFGNPSSIHSFGREARMVVEEAREQVARLIGAAPQEIVFTSGGTEANNLAIRGSALAAGKKGTQVITSAVEHHAVVETCQALEAFGFRVTMLPVDSRGLVSPQDLKQAIGNGTALVSIMHANNEVGTIEPVRELAAVAREHGIPFHTDAIQSAGKIPVNVDELGVDLLSLSAHKFNGPKGAGALYVRRGTRLAAQMHGGHQEKRRRAGTENVAGIAGLGEAAGIAAEKAESESPPSPGLRDRLEAKIRERIAHITIHGSGAPRLPNTANISFAFVEGEAIILNLDLKGIAVSTGSACSSGSLEPSHVLVAMGTAVQDVQGSVRFSLGKGNTEGEVDTVVEELEGIIERLRAMSPLCTEER